jgi:acylpyruvate hydrolase
MTARDIQDHSIKNGLPWYALFLIPDCLLTCRTEGKGYDTFCAVGNFIPAQSIKDPHALTLWLKVCVLSTSALGSYLID